MAVRFDLLLETHWEPSREPRNSKFGTDFRKNPLCSYTKIWIASCKNREVIGDGAGVFSTETDYRVDAPIMRQLKIDWFEIYPLKLQAVSHNTTRLIIPASTILCIKTVLCVLLYNYQFTVYIVTSVVCFWAGHRWQYYHYYFALSLYFGKKVL